MKARFLIFGSLVASLFLSGCNDDQEVTVSEITVSPETVPALEIGGTVELTAIITPDNATEEIRWVAYDEIVSIKSEGRKAILTAVESGTTHVFATNRTGVVVSKDIVVKVNSDEYAAFVVGRFLGTATGVFDLPEVSVNVERVAGENAQVKLTVTAEVPGLGELTIEGDQVNVKPGAEPDSYAFSGTAFLDAMGGVTFNVTGVYMTTGELLTLSLSSADGMVINITATPGAPEDYGAAIAGDYVATGELTGVMSATLTDVQITITRVDNKMAELLISADIGMGGLQTISSSEIALAAGSEPNTCKLSGTALITTMDNIPTSVEGTFDMITHALTLTIVGPSVSPINIQLDATPLSFDPSDYATAVAGDYRGSAKLSGALLAGFGLDGLELSDVPITLERVDNETVKIGMVAQVPGIGAVQIDGDAITVSTGESAGVYALSGAAIGMGTMEFSVAGTYSAADGKLTLKIESAGVTIDITAVRNADKD